MKPRIKRYTGLMNLSILLLVLLILIMLFPFPEVHMPGKSYQGELPELSEIEKSLSKSLKSHVDTLAVKIGDRNYKRPEKLKESADYIFNQFDSLGLPVSRQYFKFNQQLFENIEAELPGRKYPDRIIVIGAHYDSCDCPGANDNGSGVAALLVLADLFKEKQFDKTIRFVAFTNEEHFFSNDGMGSHFYAKDCKEKGVDLEAMFSLETIGFYDDKKKSQKFPAGLKYFYPDRGNFIAFVANKNSSKLLKKTIRSFRKNTKFPSEGLAAPDWVKGVSWSDHSQFWKQGYPAIMVTDTAFYRYPYYHTAEDTPDKIDFDRTSRVVLGLSKVIEDTGFNSGKEEEALP